VKIYLKKHLNALHPADEEAAEYLKKVKSGVAVSCEMKRPRNYANHRRYFSLLKLAFENQENFKSLDQLKEAIKFELGYTELIRKFDGTFIEKAKSINFASMNEDEFQKYFSMSIDVILKFILPGVERQELLNEVLAYG
jgi:heterodisulfide reductase subunit B